VTPAYQAVAKFGSLEVYVPPLPTVLPAVRIGITPDETNQLTSLLVCEKNHSAVVGSAVGLRPMPNAGKVLEKSKVPSAMSMSPNVTVDTFTPTLSWVIVPCGELTAKVTRAARLLEAAIRTPSRMATVVSPPAAIQPGIDPTTQGHAVVCEQARGLRRQGIGGIGNAAGSLTLADVAETVGYPHEGRFAGYYLECFGELPSATLARSRRPPP